MGIDSGSAWRDPGSPEPPRPKIGEAKPMFVRKVTVTESGERRVYLELFDRQPKPGKKTRAVARLGPVNLLAGKLNGVLRGLRDMCEENFVSASEISAERIWAWGPVLVVRHLWEELGLRKTFTAACGRKVAEAAFALTANRLVDPGYTYGMDNWLEGVCLPDELGCGPAAIARRKNSGGSGISPDSVWDSTLRKLAAKRRIIESALFDTTRAMCRNRDEAVLYELQSTFVQRMTSRGDFMGWPTPRSQRNIRLHLGIIMCGSWPLTFRFFGGSEGNVGQIKRFIEESQRRFGFRKVLYVAPSGTDEEKLCQLESLGFDYLVGVRRRRDPRAIEVIQQAGRQWVKMDASTRVQEVLLPVEADVFVEGDTSAEMPTERYFLVHSRQDANEERASRRSVVSRALKALGELKRAVEEGRLKKPATIMARAERILAQGKGYRYISWRTTPKGRFEFWKDERKSSVRQAYEGISLLRTTNADLSPSSAVAIYEGLRRLENAFRAIQDTVASRSTRLALPDLEEHVASGEAGTLFAGHILVGQLAFLVRCRLQKRLLEQNITMSLEDAVRPLETISLAELRLGGEKHFVVSPGNRTARKIVRALGIESLEPTAKTRTADA